MSAYRLGTTPLPTVTTRKRPYCFQSRLWLQSHRLLSCLPRHGPYAVRRRHPRLRRTMASPVKVSRGPRLPAVRQACPFVGGMRGVSPEIDAAMPKKQTTAGKKARAAARTGEKYTAALRRQLPPGTGPAAVPSARSMDSAHPVSLEHRSLLDRSPGVRTFRGTDLFERIGGQPTINRLVDLLYEGIGDDDQLRPMFPRDLAHSRSMSKLFFAEWLGGPGRYSE